MADDRSGVVLAARLDNRISQELKTVTADAVKASAQVETIGKKGTASFGEFITTIQHGRRQLQTLTSLLLIPFGIGQLAHLFEFALSPITDLVKKSQELKQGILDVEKVAAAFGDTGAEAFNKIRQAMSLGGPPGSDSKEIAKAEIAALTTGIGTEGLPDAIVKARQLQEIFGIGLPEAAHIAAGSIQGEVAAMAELEKITRQQVKTAADAERAFGNLGLSKRINDLTQALQHSNDIRSGRPGSQLGGANLEALRAEREQLELQFSELVTPSKGARGKAAEDAANKLRESFEKQTRAALDATKSATGDFDSQIEHIHAETQRKVDQITKETLVALAALVASGQKGATGVAGGALVLARDTNIAAAQQQEDAAVRTVERARTQDKIKDTFELERLDIAAQQHRLETQKKFFDQAEQLGNRLGSTLAGVWDEYDKGLIKSSQLTKNIIAALIKEFAGDLGGAASKAIVKAIFTQGAAADRGLYVSPSGSVQGGTPVSSSAMWHSYRNAPWRSFADSGIFRGPTLAVGGENGEEAFVRMRGGKIPVELGGRGGGGGTNVTVKIDNHVVDAAGLDQATARQAKIIVPMVIAAIQSNKFRARDAIKSV